MPRPGLRTSRFRRIIRKIPGGALIIHYKKRGLGKARCAGCGRPVSGVSGRKRPERPYGGNLCPRCSRKAIKNKILKGKK